MASATADHFTFPAHRIDLISFLFIARRLLYSNDHATNPRRAALPRGCFGRQRQTLVCPPERTHRPLEGAGMAWSERSSLTLHRGLCYVPAFRTGFHPASFKPRPPVLPSRERNECSR